MAVNNSTTNNNEKAKRRNSLVDLYRGPGDTDLPKDVLNNITMFLRKQKKVCIWKNFYKIYAKNTLG